MKTSTTRLRLYRSLYWANQGLLHAVRALEEAKAYPLPRPTLLIGQLQRAQAMIEETREVVNRTLGEWIEPIQ